MKPCTFKTSLFIATFLQTVVFAWILLFAIVIMPGLGNLDDGTYLQSFQAIDGMIQNNQPIFIMTWVGSTLAVFVCTGLGFKQRFLEGQEWKMDKIALLVASLLSFVVQVITASKNVPLNNRVHTLDFDSMSSDDLATERATFEDPWNFWNVFRGVLAWIVSMYLLGLMLRVERDADPITRTADKNKKEILLAYKANSAANYHSTTTTTTGAPAPDVVV